MIVNMMKVDHMIQFRTATPSDVSMLIDFIQALAAHEGRPEIATISPDALTGLLFGDRALATAYLVETQAGVVAYAIVAERFSSFRGTRLLYIEDMLVVPEARKSGVGKRLLSFLAQKAAGLDCERLEWSALANNDIANDFYDHLGARRETGVIHYSTTPALMQKLMEAHSEYNGRL